jgi:hypothetical protein
MFTDKKLNKTKLHTTLQHRKAYKQLIAVVVDIWNHAFCYHI